jgi:hypothetical protein
MVAASSATMHPEAASRMAPVRVLGIDMAQQIFQIVGLDDTTGISPLIS